ncbi:MAG: succinate dehydrogenase iron-sulfur subunit [Alphaproteobacteria bacterium]
MKHYFSLLGAEDIQEGKAWPVEQEIPLGKERKLEVYRYNPEDSSGLPRRDTYAINTELCGEMVLDALLYIKDEIDPTLSFRRSCREGVCGSCSMNINGVNRLACTVSLKDVVGTVRVYPLTHFEIIRDLIPDMQEAYDALALVKPWLQAGEAKKGMERLQTAEERQKIAGLWECVLCFCCSSACPSTWKKERDFFGPAIFLQAYRWIAETRDDATEDRLSLLQDPYRLYGCHDVGNCTNACPKGLDPASVLKEMKALLKDSK